MRKLRLCHTTRIYFHLPTSTRLPAIVRRPTLFSGLPLVLALQTTLTASCCAANRVGRKSPLRIKSLLSTQMIVLSSTIFSRLEESKWSSYRYVNQGGQYEKLKINAMKTISITKPFIISAQRVKDSFFFQEKYKFKGSGSD